MARLQNPQVTSQALDALAVRLDRRRAAVNTITRKRAVFHNALGYTVELGLLEVNPLGQFQRRPRAASTADPRVIASPRQVDAILKQVSRIRPELTAFFGCLYYAALRPEEAVALRRDSLTLPASGWGQLTLTAALLDPPAPGPATAPHTSRAASRLRPEGATSTVTIPPQLVSLPCWHLPAHGAAPDGRLFRGARGGPLNESLYGRIWHQACAAASISAQHAIHPVLRPYDLRHAALSLWLASGAPPAEIAARAGHSVNVLLAVYAHCIPGHDQIASRHIEQALGAGPRPAAGPPKCRDTGRIPSVMRPCHSWTQWDTAGPGTRGQDRKPARDLREHPPRRSALRTRPPDARLQPTPPQAADQARSGPQLAHRKRERSAEPLPDTHQTRHPGKPPPGLSWGFEGQVLGSNQRRLSRRFYSEPIPAHRNSH